MAPTSASSLSIFSAIWMSKPTAITTAKKWTTSTVSSWPCHRSLGSGSPGTISPANSRILRRLLTEKEKNRQRRGKRKPAKLEPGIENGPTPIGPLATFGLHSNGTKEVCPDARVSMGNVILSFLNWAGKLSPMLVGTIMIFCGASLWLMQYKWFTEATNDTLLAHRPQLVLGLLASVAYLTTWSIAAVFRRATVHLKAHRRKSKFIHRLRH